MIRRYGITGVLVVIVFVLTFANAPAATIDVLGQIATAVGDFGGTVVTELSSEGS